MAKPTPVLSAAGDYEEALERYAAHLRKDKIRRHVFNEIYGRTKKPRSKKQIMDAAGIRNRGNASQQVQNALEFLYKHHLIERHENNGQVNDRSRYLYGKAEFIRANKDKIVRLADNPKLAEKMPTKRRPLIRGVSSVRGITKQALKTKQHLTVLYLVANPEPNSPLRVDEEVKKVQEKIRGSKFRDNVTVEYRPAADLQSLIDGLNDHKPQIVHFSGHGNESGIATDGGNKVKGLSFDLLAKALAATDDPPEIVILNSCKSSAARKALFPATKVIITMQASVTDSAATAFATFFYAAIASGQSIKAAFEQGRVGVEDISISEADIPELIHAASANPSSMILT